MAFFGLVWVASWVGCFFPSQHDLIKQPDLVTSHPSIAIASAPSNQPSRLSLGRALSNFSRVVSHRILGDRSAAPPASSELPPQNREQPSQTQASWLNANLLVQSERSSQVIPVAYTPASVAPEPASPIAFFSAPLSIMQNLVWSWRLIAAPSAPLPRITVNSASAANAATDRSTRPSPRSTLPGGRLCSSDPPASPSSLTSARFQVRVKDQVVVETATQQQADQIAQQLHHLLDSKPDLAQLQPGFDRGIPAAKLGDRTLFTVDQQVATAWNCHPEILVVDWVNALRSTLDQPTFSLAEAQTKMHNLRETKAEIHGLASWYGPYFHGRQTATGETFNQDDLTAAHPTLPFDTYLKVTNLKNGKAVIVRVNDRGPYVDDRTLDLSRQAARSLDSENIGVVPISAVIMQPRVQPSQQSAPQQIARL